MCCRVSHCFRLKIQRFSIGFNPEDVLGQVTVSTFYICLCKVLFGIIAMLEKSSPAKLRETGSHLFIKYLDDKLELIVPFINVTSLHHISKLLHLHVSRVKQSRWCSWASSHQTCWSTHFYFWLHLCYQNSELIRPNINAVYLPLY